MEGCSGTCGRQGTALVDADHQVHLQLGTQLLTWADHSSEAMSCAARSAAAM